MIAVELQVSTCFTFTIMRRRTSSECYYDPERERERERRRREWMIQQEKEREHERLKRKKIEEYEREYARKKAAEKKRSTHKRRSPRRSRSESRSRSRSEEPPHRSRTKATTNNKSKIMSEKLNSFEGNTPFFKGPEQAPKIDPSELRDITVKIQRKIPAAATATSEIRRDILNAEEITLKRREGEGVKPLFDREELKRVPPPEVEEFRIIEAVGKNNLVKKSHKKRRSASLSPKRHYRSPSPQSSRSYSHRSRSEANSKHRSDDHHKDHKSERNYSHTRESSREDSRRRRGRSHSRDQDYHKSEREYSRSSRSEKDYREYRPRSKDRSYDRRELRNSSRDRHLAAPAQYVEHVPFPVYYGDPLYSQGFAPRPMLVGPGLPGPLRPQMGRGRMPSTSGLRPPYPPRFMPPDMYRAVLPPNDPRFGRMH